MIPISAPSLSELERRYLIQAFDSGWISSHGEFVERAELLLSTVTAARHSAAVSNGTVALHLALLAAGTSAGDEIIMPSLSYVATMNAALYIGARPVLVDVDADTWNISPAAAAEACTPRTRAILAVDLYGNPANYQALSVLSRDRGVALIADAAESVGSRSSGRPGGGEVDLATYSFFGNKVITSGEGGAVVTNSERYDVAIRQLRNQGVSPRRRYFHEVLGYNYRMTNLAAAILCGQLERLDELLERRQQVLSWYESRLRGNGRLRHQIVEAGNVRSPWMFTICVADWSATDRDSAVAELRERGVETRPSFVPMQQMPYVAGLQLAAPTPVADRIGREGISLPTFPDLSEQQIDQVCEQLLDVIR